MVRRVILRSGNSSQSKAGTIGALIGLLLSGIYLLNLSFGILEIPDNLPVVGNLDEVAVSAFFFGCLKYLGVDLVPFQKKRKLPAGQSGTADG